MTVGIEPLGNVTACAIQLPNDIRQRGYVTAITCVMNQTWNLLTKRQARYAQHRLVADNV